MAKAKVKVIEQGPDEEAPIVHLARETLSGDIRDHIVEYLKQNRNPLPWASLPESEQRAVVERAANFANALLRDIVEIVASDGRETITFAVKKVETAKGSIILKLESSFYADAWNALGLASTVQVIRSDTAPYIGESIPGGAHVQKDQAALPLDGVSEEPVMDQTVAGKKLGGEPKRGPDPDDTPKPKVPLDENGHVSEDGYLALAAMIQKSPEPPKDTLRKLLAFYRITSKQIDEKKLFKIAQRDESFGDDPYKSLEIPAFLRRAEKKPKPDEDDGDDGEGEGDAPPVPDFP